MAEAEIEREPYRQTTFSDIISEDQAEAERIARTAILPRGSKSASVEATTTATREDIKQITGNILYWYKRDIVKTDEECAERLDEFFKHINETGEIPTVEKMCLALGTTRKVVWDWETGKTHGGRRASMIQKAKEILAAIDAELVSHGKIPQVTYIFRSKNFFGMRDQTDVVITPNNPLGEGSTAEELQKRITDGVIVETEDDDIDFN